MKIYGDMLFQAEANVHLDSTLTQLPTTASVGEFIYLLGKTYVCIDAGPPAVWAETTNIDDIYIHTQGTAADPWTISHDLGTSDVVVQVYDVSNNVIIPNEITITDSNTVTIDFGAATTGKAVIVTGDANGVGSQAASITYDVSGATLSQPTDGTTLMRFIAVRNFRMPVSLTGSQASSEVATTSSAAYPIKKNGTSIGTINYAAAATAGTFTFSTETDFTSGDILTVEAPATADATHDGLVWTFKCTTI